MSNNKINFTEEEIESMKVTADTEDIIENLKPFTKQKEKMGVESITLARLFLDCYDCLYNSRHKFKQSEEDETDNKTNKLELYLKQFDTSELRSLVEDYGDGSDFGSYYLQENIKDLVIKQRIQLIDLVLLFFRIFGEE